MMRQRASQYRMPRWIVPALFALIVAVCPALAQFGGMRMPGSSRYPGGGYPPGQQGSNGPQANKVYGPTETLTGSLREFSASSLVIDAGDDRIVLVQIQNGTKYLSTMDKVKASDFEPGDHVTVEATRDDNDHYYSKTITMNKKGTAEEKSAAMQASSASSHGGGGNGASGSGSSSDDSDPDRPRLHRTTSDGATASAPAPDTVPAQTSAPSNRTSSSGGSSGSTRDNGDSATITPGPVRRPAVSAPVDSSPSIADDSAPPVLRRGAPASQSPGTQVASAEQPGGAVRPSLSAEDVNGVTRLPVIAPSTDGAAPADRDVRAPRPTAPYSDNGGYGGGDPVIDQARDEAFSFSETLPNYVVKQVTNRYATGSARGGRTSWQPLDIVSTDLVYEDGKERYTIVMINGKPTKYIEQTGSWSEGEFASMLQAILAPGTNAEFRNQKPVTFVNRAAFRYDYTVDQPRSTWTLHADGQTYKPSYTGAIWVDKATYRVLRIEISARNLPRDFPLDTAESSIDYDFVMIGDQKVLLPAHAESLSCSRGTPDCTRNTTDFRNYRKYGAETDITFEGPTEK